MVSGTSLSLQSGVAAYQNYKAFFAGLALNQQMVPVFLGLMLAAAGAWIYLSNRLFNRLQQNYPDLYEKLGSPKSLKHKSLSVNLKVIGFLYRQDGGIFLDAEVTSLIRGLRAVFLIYLISLTGCLMLLLEKWAAIRFG